MTVIRAAIEEDGTPIHEGQGFGPVSDVMSGFFNRTTEGLKLTVQLAGGNQLVFERKEDDRLDVTLTRTGGL